MKKLLSLLLSVLALPAMAATSYFVDPASGNDSNAGTSTGAAWAHLPGTVGFSGSGWHVINNGDSVYVKGGSVNNCQVLFNATWYNGSAAYDSILIQSGNLTQSWGTGKAVFDGQNTRGYCLDFGATSGSAVLGITVDGFECKNAKAGSNVDPGGNGSCLIGMGGNTPINYISVKRCWLHDAPPTSVNSDDGHGIEMAAVTNFNFYFNEIGPGIGHKAIEPYQSSQGAITNNYLHGTGDHVIALTKAAYLDIANNLIYFPTNTALQPACGIVFPSTYYIDAWNNIIFKQNASDVWGVSGSITYAAASGGAGYGATNRFVFNTIYNLNGSDGHFCVPLRVGDPQATSANTNFVSLHNLFVSDRTTAGLFSYMIVTTESIDDQAKFNDYWYTASSDQVVDAYNGSSDSPATVATFSPGAGHVFSNNQQVNPNLTGGTLPNGLDANYHPNTLYFQISSTSPAVVTNTGDAVLGDAVHGYRHDSAKFKYDIAGNDRSVSSYYPMGAYAFAAASGGLDIVITVQPTSQTIFSGQTASFSVTATGGTLTYQWYTNGIAASGATSATWNTPAMPLAMSGTTVYVIVTDASGSLQSSTVTLTVNPDPTISVQPQSQTVAQNNTATFSVTASGATTLSYQWNWFGTNVTGATSSSWTTPLLAAAQSGSSVYCTVTDTAGSLQSANAILTVTSPGTVLKINTATAIRVHNGNPP